MQKKEQIRMLDAEQPKNKKEEKSPQSVINPNLPVLSAIYRPVPKNQPGLQYCLYYYLTNKTGHTHTQQDEY
eukprot:11887456-Ditylum_brightwellii.AAC.1